jgi:hypothetical protein
MAASPAQIRQALLKLFDAEKTNKANIDEYLPEGQDPLWEIWGDKSPSEKLRGARQKAREVQGVDPLAPPGPRESIDLDTFPDEGTFYGRSPDDPIIETTTAPGTLSRIPEKDPARLPDSEARRFEKGEKAELIQAMEDEFIDLQKQFERLAGRPPSAEEMANIGTLEYLVDLLEDASGGKKPVVRPTIADDIDEIPF